MKKIMLWTVVCLGALMGTASAQMVDTIRVTLPFDASVRGVTLPAGEYTIRELQDDGGSSVLEVSSFGGRSLVALAMQVVAPKDRPVSRDAQVVLKRTEAGYEIDTVWLADREIGYQFFK
jgi:hypothetical protein